MTLVSRRLLDSNTGLNHLCPISSSIIFKNPILLMPNQTVATGRLFPLQFTTDINGPSLLLTFLLHLEICCSVWLHRNSVWIVHTGCPPGHITNLAGTWHVTVVKGTQCCWKDPGDLVTAFIMSHGSLWPGQPGPARHCNFSLYCKNTIFLSFQLLLSTTEVFLYRRHGKRSMHQGYFIS